MPAGTYHTVVMVFTVDSQGKLLLTRRAPGKQYGGYWEVTGGSGIAGEDSLTSAVRELREETGLTAPKERLLLLGTLREPEAFMDCYLYCPGESSDNLPVTLQEGETVDFQWVSFHGWERLIHEGAIPPPVAMRYGYVREKLTAVLGKDAWEPDAPGTEDGTGA
jgi:8-oxo-dGTP pyrophosphatase MutT (NUDIX family)